MKPNRLTKKETKKLQKAFPKIPKSRLNKEELEWRSAFKKARIEDICWNLAGIFLSAMTLISIIMMYLSLKQVF